MQSVSISTKVMSSNPVHGEAYSMQHYVIKFVSDLLQVCGFLQVLRFPPPMRLDRHNKTENLLKVTLNTINQPNHHFSHYVHLIAAADRFQSICLNVVCHISKKPLQRKHGEKYWKTKNVVSYLQNTIFYYLTPMSCMIIYLF